MGFRAVDSILVGAVILFFIGFGLIGIGLSKGGPTGLAIGSSNAADQSLITKAPADMLPTRDDISSKMSTEFTIDEDAKDATLDNATGFESGRTISTSKMEGSVGFISVDYTVYKFDTIQDAKSWYDNAVSKIKSYGGYKEISVSGCFAWKENAGALSEVGESDCLNKNVAYVIGGSSSGTLRSIDSFLNDGTNLLKTKVV